MVIILEAQRFEEEKVPCKGPTIGDLIEYLSQFPAAWPIGILSWDNYCKEEPVLEDHHISTVLVSRGERIEN